MGTKHAASAEPLLLSAVVGAGRICRGQEKHHDGRFGPDTWHLPAGVLCTGQLLRLTGLSRSTWSSAGCSALPLWWDVLRDTTAAGGTSSFASFTQF